MKCVTNQQQPQCKEHILSVGNESLRRECNRQNNIPWVKIVEHVCNIIALYEYIELL